VHIGPLGAERVDLVVRLPFGELKRVYFSLSRLDAPMPKRQGKREPETPFGPPG